MQQRWKQGCEEWFALCPDYSYLKGMLSLSVKAEGAARLALCHRREEEREYFLLLNESACPYEGKLEFAVSGRWIYEADLLTGELSLVNRGSGIWADFAPGQLRCFIAAGRASWKRPLWEAFPAPPVP